ncbi:tagaturonate reductase [uncultured Flavobacterium sp.]|uniref:tagaturonate reductase n=1 Tax=uncultured Flavobacterium sp. TaxID=165435 RepID=UPI00292DFA6D|nr:tagaturonate reductase [uncultured Flavobacterium sp.]
MEKINRSNTEFSKRLPIKIVQFGGGNFLRAFVEYAFQKLNQKADFNGGIAVVQSINKDLANIINAQDGLYTLFMKGVKKGEEIQEKELITNIVKAIDPYASFQEFLALAKEEELAFVISNTTEAGIKYIKSDRLTMQPPVSFPAKLTVLLYERFKYFNGDKSKALTIIPCELINYNSDVLKEIVLKYCTDWNLESDFKLWVINDCSFHNTLVDRIVPGYPKDQIEEYNSQLSYKDDLIVSAENFFLWVIEGDDKLKAKLPFEKTDLDVKIVADMQPYRTRKVRILNGVHTVMVPFSLLCGNETVKETLDNAFTGDFINKVIFDEINETLNIDKAELRSFAEEILDRFRNPFIKHLLSSIALNSISKFKVRVLPSLTGYVAIHHKLPVHLTFAFATLIRFYKGTWKGETLPVNDSEDIVTFFSELWKSEDYTKIAQLTLQNKNFWDEDLSLIPSLTEAIAIALEEIDTNGVEQGFVNFQKQIFPFFSTI